MALDYAHGRISRSRYLCERAQFLDALTGQTRADGVAAQPAASPLVRPAAEEATIPIDLTPSRPRRGRGPVRFTPPGRTGRILAAIIGISVAALILLMTVLPGVGERRPAVTDQGTADGGAPAAGGGATAPLPGPGRAAPGGD
jgi:hypothetical protein